MKETYTKEELEALSLIYDEVYPKIQEAVKRGSLLLNPVKKELSLFADKNANILQTNIIGKQLLFNKQTEEKILNAIGIDPKRLLELFKESEYFKQFGQLQLREQLLFSIPLIMLSKEFYDKGKLAESQFLYMSAFYKPYATVVFKYFGKYEVNEDQMRYTVENLSERYDIKKQGTLYGVIGKMAESSFDNYIASSKTKTFTDRELHVIFTAGIYSRLNSFVQTIFGEYQKNKGKKLYFDDPTFEGSGDSAGETFERDIQSDSAVKDQLTKKAVMILNKNLPDEKLLEMAAKYGFVGTGATYGQYSYSGVYTSILRNVVLEIIEKYYKDLPILIESIIGSFLFEMNPSTGQKFTAKDLRTAMFINHSSQTFRRSPNTKNENTLRVRNMIAEMLENVSTEYVNWGTTKKSALKYALHFYLLMIIQKG
jgi:hypothetical protein